MVNADDERNDGAEVAETTLPSEVVHDGNADDERNDGAEVAETTVPSEVHDGNTDESIDGNKVVETTLPSEVHDGGADEHNDSAEDFGAENHGDGAEGSNDDVTVEAQVCSTCGGTPCQLQQHGLSVVNLMTHDFDHETLASEGKVRDPVSKEVIEGKIVRRVAYKCFQYEKYGSISVAKALPIPRCVIDQICFLYP